MMNTDEVDDMDALLDTHDIVAEPVSSHFGVKVSGIDLAQALEARQVATLKQLFRRYQILILPRQALTPTNLVRFASHFGVVEEPRSGTPLVDGHRSIAMLQNRDGRGPARHHSVWHCDRSFQRRPPFATVLQAQEVPRSGGDTLFADLCAAYEDLPCDLLEKTKTLRARHDAVPYFATYFADVNVENRRARMRALMASENACEHRLVKKHPESGRSVLYVNRAFAARITALAEPESQSLLTRLFEHTEKPEYQIRWRWAPGDIIMWDNRSTAHCALFDYGDECRRMWRLTVA